MNAVYPNLTEKAKAFTANAERQADVFEKLMNAYWKLRSIQSMPEVDLEGRLTQKIIMELRTKGEINMLEFQLHDLKVEALSI